MSLVENLARRKHTNLELLDGLRLLAARGDTPALIARKTGLDARWVRDVVHLLKTGEERLIAAVEAGGCPCDWPSKSRAVPRRTCSVPWSTPMKRGPCAATS